MNHLRDIDIDQVLVDTLDGNISAEEQARHDAEQAFTRFMRRIADAETPPAQHRSLWKWIGGVAASLLVLFSATYFSYQRGQADVTASFAPIVVKAPSGSSTQLTLPDGTSVVLNASSTLSYSQGFGLGERNVHLEGEAFFSVKRNEEVPFLVESDNISVRVLGTKFNFKDYAEDNLAEVFLEEGVVKMSDLLHADKPLTLKPNQCVILDKQLRTMTVKDMSAAAKAGWSKGVLSFSGESLEEIAKILERSYGVKVTISDTKKRNLHFYAGFSRNTQSVKDVMEALATTNNLKYKITGKHIVIY